MRNRVIGLFTAAALLFTPVAVQATLHPHRDVATFDVKGLRLYESSDDVLARLRTLAATNPAILPDAPHPFNPSLTQCVSQQAESAKLPTGSPIGPGSCVSLLSYEGTSYQLSISFIEDFPAHPGRMVANRVLMQTKDIAGNTTELIAAAKSKYGIPDEKSSGSAFYCNYPTIGANLRECTDKGPRLVINAGAVDLVDMTFYARQAARIQHYLDSLVSGRPSL